MSNFNSISDIFAELIRLTNNSLEQQQKTTESIISTSDTITIELENALGETETHSIPTWGNITARIASLESILNILTNGTDIKASFRLPDGSYRRIIEYKSDIEPKSFDTFPTPSTFKSKNNWFFETLLNPSLVIELPIPSDYPSDVSKTFVKRVIVLPNSDTQISDWENDLKNRNDLDYNETIDYLDVKGIGYFIDDDIKDLPLNILRFAGQFDVLGLRTSTVTNDGSGQTIIKQVYRLNKITYSDNLLTTFDTLELKVGDVLLFGVNTEYRVDEIDITTNEVILSLVHGTEGVKIGTNVFKLKSAKSNVRSVEIIIANDEKQCIFVKPVDADIHIAAENWSKGVSFDSNELEITTSTGVETLDTFYNNSVFDLGKQFLAIAKENTVPSVYGVTPNAPVLDDTTLQIVQINKHATNSTESKDIKQKYSDKVAINAEIESLNKTIELKKQQLNQNVFTNDSERNTAKNEFNSLINEKSVKISQYSSILTELTTLTSDNSSFLIKPKYRLRGFFAMPDTKTHIKTGVQEIIQFEVQYRYLRKDGNNEGIKTIKFTDTDSTERNASFTDWVSVKSEIRAKVWDSEKGYFTWDDVNVEDADLVNINQIDIPFSKNEKIEIRVRSVSEAGYPINPKLSTWSNSIIREFPDSLTVGDDSSFIVSESEQENTRIKLLEELNAQGLDTHLANSTTTNDKTYHHNADDLHSGFFDTNGLVISLFQKMQEYENRIASLENELSSISNVLSVYLVDDENKTIQIANNQTVQLFGGYYSEILTDTTNPNLATSQAGKVVTKQWNLILENKGASIIELASLFPGAFESDLDTEQKEFDYQKRLYHDVPINITGLNESDIITPEEGNSTKTKNDSKKHISNFQTKQVKSQFIYARKTNVSLTGNFYLEPTIGSEFWYEPTLPIVGLDADIWDGTFSGTVPNGNGEITEFCIHKDHPNLLDVDLQSLGSINDRMAYLLRPLDVALPLNQASGYPKMRHTQLFNLNANELNGTKQLVYTQSDTNKNHTDVILGNLNGSNGYMYPAKQGFFDNDEYLVGGQTNGSYLYFSTDRIDDTFVNGTDALAIKNIDSSNSISFKIYFQYRMTDKLGRIAGLDPAPLNVTYRKQMGIDIKTKNQTLFSFDIDVSAKFKRDNLVS